MCTRTCTCTHTHGHTYPHAVAFMHTCTCCIYTYTCTTHTHPCAQVHMHHINVLMYIQMVKNLPAMQRTQVQSLGVGWDPPAGWMQVGPRWMEGGGAPASDHRTWGIKGCQVQDAGLCIPLFRPQLDPTQADGVATAQVSGGAGGPGLARMHRRLRHPQRPGTAGIGPIEACPQSTELPLAQFYQTPSSV